MKIIKDKVFIGIGLLFVAIAVLLENTIDIEDTVYGFLLGVGIGIELYGIVRQCRGNR